MGKKVVIIGAGFGGMSAAAYLAKDGYDVTVLEKTDQPGGRARVLKTKGYTFDMGPSWYLMPDVFEEFFADFGHKPTDFYALKELNPSYTVFGEHDDFAVPTYPKVRNLFKQKDPGSEVRLDAFLEETKLAYKKVRADVLNTPMTRPKDYISKTALSFFGSKNMYRSYHARIKEITSDAELQKILEFMSVFMGGSPYNIPAIYSLLGYIDLGMGVQYPMGGFGELAKAFEKNAKKNGTKFLYNHAVSSIEVKEGKASGVFVGKKFIAADIVLANADYQFVETKLLPAATQSYDQNYWQKKTVSPSCLLLSIGVKKRLAKLQHHNLFFDTDWQTHFTDIFTSQNINQRPLFYLCVPSKTDDSVAPKGHENLFVLAPMPAGKKLTKTDIKKLTNNILGRIEDKIGQQFQNEITVMESRTSEYFEDTFNAYRGNAFGLSHTLLQSGPLRPRMRSKKIPNLYFAGQYTNPGTGVPMVVLSGKVAAAYITSSET